MIEEVVITLDPVVATEIVVDVAYGAGGSSFDPDRLVFGEHPAGVLDGVNNIFTSAFNFVPETVEVYLNGILQDKPDDYNTFGNNTITFMFSPDPEDTLTINYIKL